jgi:hypothetical protein
VAHPTRLTPSTGFLVLAAVAGYLAVLGLVTIIRLLLRRWRR